MTALTGWPLMPPLALMSSTSICRVLRSGSPRYEAGPVMEKMPPTIRAGFSLEQPPSSKVNATTTPNKVPSIILTFIIPPVSLSLQLVDFFALVNVNPCLLQEGNGLVQIVKTEDDHGILAAVLHEGVHVLHVDAGPG